MFNNPFECEFCVEQSICFVLSVMYVHLLSSVLCGVWDQNASTVHVHKVAGGSMAAQCVSMAPQSLYGVVVFSGYSKLVSQVDHM